MIAQLATTANYSSFRKDQSALIRLVMMFHTQLIIVTVVVTHTCVKARAFPVFRSIRTEMNVISDLLPVNGRHL